MDDVEADLREQLTEAFADADYPVEDQMGLVPALPDGPSTRFEAGGGEVRFTAMEMAAKLSGHQNFPYQNVDALVDDVIEGLKAEGLL
jgi:hypothetical protein